jgi:hypothetical protein
MTSFLETALDLAQRGFHVLPLIARTKKPIVFGGCNAGTRDHEQIALWWKRNPDANIGIDCGHTNLIVMDADHGLTCLEDFIAWRDRNGLPATYSVRSGRRFKEDGSPEFGVQMYYRGSCSCRTWMLDGCTGDFKSKGGLVVAPPSIHPDGGEAYEVLLDLPLVSCPEFILSLPTADGKEKAAGQTNGDGLIETENRNDDMCSFIGKIRKRVADLGEPECGVICLHRNERYAKGPMPEEEVQEIVAKQYRQYPDVGPDAVVVVSSSKSEEKKITDWRERYHTKDEAENAPPISFLIDGFLQCEGVTGLTAPVRERKSLIALNIAHALVTGEPLFDHFKVVKRPSRVLYLCPESGLGPFTDRLKKIGLLKHVGDTFFYRTLSKDGRVKLSDLDEELPGSVVFLDTAIRFLEGKENDSSDVRDFADGNFALLQRGAQAVVLLHHAPKEMGDHMTLENALRGSGDIGAFLASCWGTRLQDPSKPYESSSYLENLKQRDFESQPFEVTSGPDCRLHIVKPSLSVAVLTSRKGFKPKKDEDVAMQMLRDNPGLSHRDMAAKLQAAGIDRKKDWVGAKRRELSGTGVVSGDAP